MAFSGNNQALYNAALNGCLAGQLAGQPSTDGTTAHYATAGNVASAFAKEVDSLIVADAQLTSAGASVVPATAAQAAAAIAKPSAMFQFSYSYWLQRSGGSDVTATDYAVGAAAVAAQYAQAVAQYALAPGGTSLS